MRKIALALGLCFSFLSSSVMAGSQTGEISQIIVRGKDGLTYFYLTGTANGRPACATNRYWIIKDENSAIAQKQLALLIAAKAAGQTVSVGGLDTCTRWPDGEDLNYVIF